MSVERVHIAQFFDGQQMQSNKVFTIENTIIVDIDDNVQKYDKKLKGLVAPGFIDLQVNGGGGVLFNRTSTLSGIKKCC